MIQLLTPILDIAERAEVEALVRLHGLQVDEACEIVGIDSELYTPFCGHLEHLPTPSQIERMALAIRDGEIVVNVKSFDRWKAIRDDLATRAELGADDDDFVLAGRIDDDAVVLPPWLYSGGIPD